MGKSDIKILSQQKWYLQRYWEKRCNQKEAKTLQKNIQFRGQVGKGSKEEGLLLMVKERDAKKGKLNIQLRWEKKKILQF